MLPIKVQGKGEQPTPGECNNFVTILVRREMPDACHITLGDNPAGQGFVLRDLVLIELSGHAPPAPTHPFQLGEGGSKFQKSLLGVSEILILVEGGILLGGNLLGGEGHVILK